MKSRPRVLGLLVPTTLLAAFVAACGEDRDSGVTGNTGAMYTARGTYAYDSGTGILTLNTTSSDFECEGPEIGTVRIAVQFITSTTMIWLLDQGEQMTLTRDNGTNGDIVGTWEASDDETGNSWEVVCQSNGSFSVVGHITRCKGDTYDVVENGIPQFVGVNYIDPDVICRISRFRSGVGHDYSDDFESCRSMKHYFQPSASADWSTVQICSPINGSISRLDDEWAGTQVQIKSEECPAFVLIIFHLSLSDPLEVGDIVTAGQHLGTHIGSQTMSDIAVRVNTPSGWKLVSYFDVMSDSAFQDYLRRGVNSRGEAIISKEARDADPLVCDGEEFADGGNLENWVNLN